jgi:hypothetical protein
LDQRQPHACVRAMHAEAHNQLGAHAECRQVGRDVGRWVQETALKGAACVRPCGRTAQRRLAWLWHAAGLIVTRSTARSMCAQGLATLHVGPRTKRRRTNEQTRLARRQQRGEPGAWQPQQSCAQPKTRSLDGCVALPEEAEPAAAWQRNAQQQRHAAPNATTTTGCQRSWTNDTRRRAATAVTRPAAWGPGNPYRGRPPPQPMGVRMALCALPKGDRQRHPGGQHTAAATHAKQCSGSATPSNAVQPSMDEKQVTIITTAGRTRRAPLT